MSYRVLFLVPSDFNIGTLSPAEAKKFTSVIHQYVFPMPGTIESNGKRLLDCLVSDEYTGFHELGFIEFAVQKDSGEVLTAPDTGKFLEFLPMRQEFNEAQEPVGDPQPPELREPHTWAGWPKLVE